MAAAQAARRPDPARHSVHEIVIHAAYWKHAVRRRLTGEKRGSFPLKGSNWFPRGESDLDKWGGDVRLLDEAHRELRQPSPLETLGLRVVDKPGPCERHHRARPVTSGLAALGVKISRKKNSPSETIANPNEKSIPVDQHERSSHDVH